MRKVTAHLFSSIDGNVESPNLFQFDSFGQEEGEMMGRVMMPVDAAIMGRKIYTEWAEYWPNHNEDFGLMINPMKKYVASSSLEEPLSWENSELIKGDLIEFVRDLKEQEGGDITLCGISVIRQLLVEGLVDELILTVHPASGGPGKRLFDGIADPFRLELIDSQITPVGNAILTYRKKDVQE